MYCLFEKAENKRKRGRGWPIFLKKPLIIIHSPTLYFFGYVGTISFFDTFSLVLALSLYLSLSFSFFLWFSLSLSFITSLLPFSLFLSLPLCVLSLLLYPSLFLSYFLSFTVFVSLSLFLLLPKSGTRLTSSIERRCSFVVFLKTFQ